MQRVRNLAVAFAAMVFLAANLLNLVVWHSRPLFGLFIVIAALVIVLLKRRSRRQHSPEPRAAAELTEEGP